MTWLRQKHWWLLLNSLAMVILVILLAQMRGTPAWLFGADADASRELIASPVFRSSGHWAVRFLLLSLAMSPLYYLAGWRTPLTLRKSAGLWAVAFATLHGWLFINDTFWRKVWPQLFARLGLVAFIILVAMAVTSHRPAMRLLGRNWKRLHRLVYIAGSLVVLHGLISVSHWTELATLSANTWLLRGYCLLFGILMLLRVPPIRSKLPLGQRKTKPRREFASA